MGIHLNPRGRGILAVRAETGSATKSADAEDF